MIPAGEMNNALSVAQTWILNGASRQQTIANLEGYYWYYPITNEEAVQIADDAGYYLQLAGYDTPAYPLAGLAPTPDALPSADDFIGEIPDTSGNLTPTAQTPAAASSNGLNLALVAGLGVLGLGGGYLLTRLMKRRR